MSREPTKNTIIAPVPMPVGVRVRSDSLEALRKDSLSSEKGKSPPMEDAPLTRPSDIFSTPEIRKSKSLTRKIKELSSTTNRGVDSPTTKELEGLERVSLARSVSSTPTITRTPGTSMTPITDGNLANGKEQFLPGHNISLLRESPNRSTNSSPSLGAMQPIRLNKMNSSASTQSNLAPIKHVVPNLTFEKIELVAPTVLPLERGESEETTVYQHFSLPKSVNSTSASTSNTSQKSSLTSSASKSKPSSNSTFSQYNNMECILVESDVSVDKDDKASENDRILQERLQQAKALGRKEDSGATLHSFSLWKSKPVAVAPAATQATINTQLNTSSSSADVNTSTMSAMNKSSSKLRGPKSARENQMLRGHESLDNTQAAVAGNFNHNKQAQDISFTDQNISLIKMDASFPADADDEDDSSQVYSDDDFVKDDDFQDYSKESSDISNGQFHSKKARGLRSKVNGAKKLDASFASNLNKSNRGTRSSDVSRNDDATEAEITDDLDCSYSSFACKEEDKVHHEQESDTFLVNETSIHHMDDIMSDYSVEEDVVIARDLESSQNNHVEFGTMSSVQTMMSRSGPAAFGSTLDTSFEKVVIDPFAQTVSLDPTDLARRVSSGGLENKTNGMQYEPLRMRSLTSRGEHKEHVTNAASQRLERVSKTKLPTQAAPSSQKEKSTNAIAKAAQPNDTKPSKYQQMRNLKSAQKKTGGSSNSSIIESYFDQQSQPGDQSVVSREIHNSSPLSELSDNEDQNISNVEKSTQEETEQSRDDQAFSPLKWKKGEVIGEGTFGKVFKGLNEKTGELLAIKQICLADGSEKEVEEIRKEISVMWDLNHEHIVR